MAGAPRLAERSDALAEPEAKRDHDTYGMKRAGVRPREQDSDLGRGLVLRWLIYWDAGRRLGPTPADTPPQILVRCKRLVAG